MKDYLLTKRPRITIYLILILFVSNIITLISSRIGAFVMLYPTGKTQKTPKNEIEKAMKLKKEYFELKKQRHDPL